MTTLNTRLADSQKVVPQKESQDSAWPLLLEDLEEALEATSPEADLEIVEILERQTLRLQKSPKSSTEEEPALDALVLHYLSLKKANADRQKLRNKIVSACLPYVHRLAKSLARRADDPLEDLIQVGTIGLIKALDKFNPLAGTQFKTYATYYINGEIRHYLRDQVAMIKPSRKVYELYYRMNQIVERLSRRLGRTPTDLEIAQELECPLTDVHQAQAVTQRTQMISLDQYQIGHQGDEPAYIERLVDDKHLDLRHNHENRLMLDKALKKLKPELRIVVQLTFFEDQTQTEIAERLEISQMQVSRRLRKAMELLAQSLTETA